MKNSKKWNVLIFILFVLMFSMLTWILINKYLYDILWYWKNLEEYYKAYYLAFWWIELSQAKIKNHTYWFEDEI